MMRLSELTKNLKGCRNAALFPDIEIAGVTADSRKVKPGFLFVAIQGLKHDGHDHVEEACRLGAAAVVVLEGKGVKGPAAPKIQLEVRDDRKAWSSLSAVFHGQPSLHMNVFGVTGTNGKTTVTSLLESILREDGREPGVIGTVNYRYCGKTLEATHTTPDPEDLHRMFSEMQKLGVTDVVMEVSSHALEMSRVEDVHFQGVALTNLTQDHLDFHQSLEKYGASKSRLFSELLPKSRRTGTYAVINMESAFGKKTGEGIGGKVVRVGLNSSYDVGVSSCCLSEEGITMQLVIEGKVFSFSSSLVGRFNVENILVAVGLAVGAGISPEKIRKGIAEAPAVRGRLQKIPNKKGIHVFVDYAHTPDALARVGENLREFLKGRLITVFGCGGDRDAGKRPLMGAEVSRFSDVMVVTSDNPRTENPKKIIEDVLSGVRDGSFDSTHLFVIEERREAIRRALSLALEGDTVLVAGKGHENYQIIGKTKIPFDDAEVVREVLGGME